MNHVFLIGNGLSRQPIDLRELQKHGPIWGCNALYRDMVPDMLLITDKAMQDEAYNAVGPDYCKMIFKNTKENFPWRREHHKVLTFNTVKGCKVQQNSGVYLLYFALKWGFKEIWLLGFDFCTPKTNAVNNVYKGTQNYKSNPKFRDSLLKPFKEWEAKNRNHVTFKRVFDENHSRVRTDFDIDIQEFRRIWEV
jgi:hypothetical protein